jgi:hypothetical protein
MIKQFIAVSSLLIGGNGFAFIGYLQTHPMALTHTTLPETGNEALGARLFDQPVFAISDDRISFEPVRIAANLHRPRPIAERSLEACAEWRAIGVSYVTDGRAVGTHLVRDLCEEAP